MKFLLFDRSDDTDIIFHWSDALRNIYLYTNDWDLYVKHLDTRDDCWRVGRMKELIKKRSC